MKRKKCLTSLVLIVSTALSWATAQTPFVAPSAYSATWPSACDKIDWSKNTGVSGTGSQSIVSDKGLNLSATLATTGTGLSIPGYSSSFANFGSWYEVRAVNSSIQPFDQAFVTRVNSTGTNTVTITFPQSVNNVLLAASDLDAVGSSTADYGDWAQFTGRYGGTTYNPDILVGGGTNGMVIKAYKSAPPTTAAFGATMSISQSGLGNSTMKAASAPNSGSGYNTLMGTSTAYTKVSATTGATSVNTQGQGLAYFKGPITSLTIVTGSNKPSGANAAVLSNIFFCSPSITVTKALGTPLYQPNGSFNLPYSLTLSNNSYNVGLYPDTSVRDATFVAATPTPTGYDTWADVRPQIVDPAVTNALAGTNVASASVVGIPSISNNTTGTTIDVNTAFAGTGTAATPTTSGLISTTTAGRVGTGKSFTANFTLNVVPTAANTAMIVNNSASGVAILSKTGTATADPGTSVSGSSNPTTLNNPVTITKTVSPAYILVPYALAATTTYPVTYKLTVNNSTTPQSTITVNDTLPAGLTYSSASLGGVGLTNNGSGQNLSFTLSSLPSGTSTITLNTTASVTPATNQSAYSNTASVTNASQSYVGVTLEPVTTNVIYTTLAKTVQNLSVPGSAVGTSATAKPGDRLEYCMTYHNFSSVNLPSYIVSDDVPANSKSSLDAYDILANAAGQTGTGYGVRWVRSGVTSYYTSATDTDTGSFTNSGGQYAQGQMRLNIGTLAPQATGTMCFRTTIN